MKIQFLAVTLALQIGSATIAFAGCEVVDGGKKSPFDGSSLAGLQVEKKSLVTLNKTFPALNVIEKAFKGEAQTCTSCSEKYITCTND